MPPEFYLLFPVTQFVSESTTVKIVPLDWKILLWYLYEI